MCVRFCMYHGRVSRQCAAIGTQYEKRWTVLPKAAALPQPQTHYHVYSSTAAVKQYTDSRASSSRLYASSQRVCVWLVHSRRPNNNIFTSNCNDQTIIVGPHTRYTKRIAAAKTVAHTSHWIACVPPFRLKAPPGYQVNPIPKGKLVHGNYYTQGLVLPMSRPVTYR